MFTNLATLYRNKPPIICKEQIDTGMNGHEREKKPRNILRINKPLKYGLKILVFWLFMFNLCEKRREKKC